MAALLTPRRCFQRCLSINGSRRCCCCCCSSNCTSRESNLPARLLYRWSYLPGHNHATSPETEVSTSPYYFPEPPTRVLIPDLQEHLQVCLQILNHFLKLSTSEQICGASFFNPSRVLSYVDVERYVIESYMPPVSPSTRLPPSFPVRPPPSSVVDF